MITQRYRQLRPLVPDKRPAEMAGEQERFVRFSFDSEVEYHAHNYSVPSLGAVVS